MSHPFHFIPAKTKVLVDLIISEEFDRIKQLSLLRPFSSASCMAMECNGLFPALAQIEDTVSVKVDIFQMQLRLDRVQLPVVLSITSLMEATSSSLLCPKNLLEACIPLVGSKPAIPLWTVHAARGR